MLKESGVANVAPAEGRISHSLISKAVNTAQRTMRFAVSVFVICPNSSVGALSDLLCDLALLDYKYELLNANHQKLVEIHSTRNREQLAGSRELKKLQTFVFKRFRSIPEPFALQLRWPGVS